MFSHTLTSSTTRSLSLAIYWKLLSYACFGMINAIVRYLTGGASVPIAEPLPVYMIMLFQNAIGALFILPVFLLGTNGKNLNLASFATRHIAWHTARITTAVLGIALWYLSLRYIPMAQVVALSFMAPIITVIAARFFLREELTFYKNIAIALSIFGSFLVIRPDRALSQLHITWPMFFPLAAAVIFAFDKLISRKLLAQGESPQLLTFYLLIFMGPLCLLASWYFGWVTPSIAHWPWLIAMGVLAALAHFSFSKAFALAEVTTLLPFGAAKLILCGMIGYIAFAEIPNRFDIWVGIIILTASTILLNNRKEQ